ncbi:hypothetical protein, partial [Paraglaciecola sp.]|uniref:hypothetical protein n=1 Tax=Paraglaciecola sp. TaxID=1920173 RepID=UPI003EF7D6A2
MLDNVFYFFDKKMRIKSVFASLFLLLSVSSHASVPSTPGTPSASASGTTINLAWGASSSATYYKLQYNDGSGTWRTSSGTY